jgi:aryl-alcohol dehydrogenase-like predicted oxidoreductase
VDKLKSVLPGNLSLPDAALRFILSNPTVSTTIAGMRKPDHVRQNIAASDAGQLPADLLQQLKQHRWDRTPQPWSD